jgi:hypothetical protein
MHKKLMIGTVAIGAALSAPALAADFSIVREGPTGTCQVVETRPTDTKTVIVGNKAFTTRAEAEKQITVLCK